MLAERIEPQYMCVRSQTDTIRTSNVNILRYKKVHFTKKTLFNISAIRENCISNNLFVFGPTLVDHVGVFCEVGGSKTRVEGVQVKILVVR